MTFQTVGFCLIIGAIVNWCVPGFANGTFQRMDPEGNLTVINAGPVSGDFLALVVRGMTSNAKRQLPRTT
jgi:hypothetical protein